MEKKPTMMNLLMAREQKPTIMDLLKATPPTVSKYPFNSIIPMALAPNKCVKTNEGILTIELVKKRIKERMLFGGDIDIKNGFIIPSIETLRKGDGIKLKTAVLYADLRGFTNMVSVHPKSKSISVLDIFITEMTKVISDYKGVVEDCAGDRIMAVFARKFNDTSVKPIHEAITCALWMQNVIEEAMNPILIEKRLPLISCGIGIDYGQVVVTKVGLKNNTKIVYLGDPANYAAKLEDVANPGGTSMSEIVYIT